MRPVLLSLVVLAGGFDQFTRGGDATDDLSKRAKASLAQLEGEIAADGLKEPVEVLRDRWGVPHIYAKNPDDLFFAQGFVAAQDRLFQIDLWRRVALGEMAEIVGPDAVEADRFARLLRYRGDMGAEWTSYSPDTKEIATAFTGGINAYIDHIGKKLPIEFELLGITPGKWRAEDILGRMSGIVMSRNFGQEIARAQLIHQVGLEKARLLAPTDPPVAFAPAAGLDLAGIDKRILAGYEAMTKVLQFTPPGGRGEEAQTESNNWVVAGYRSRLGKPLLASDPHRAIAVPSLRYLVHLNAPGWNVIGAGEPALPGVALGHNERIAWGITIICTDQADIYVEETNPKDATAYKVGERWMPMEIVRDTIRVKGEAKPRTLELRYTRHGPVLFQDPERNRAYALKWAGSEPGGAAYLGALAVARAQNKTEFLQALKSWKIPGLNFVYADKDYNIGWVAAALTPVRKHDGLLPVPGNGGFEWQGYLDVKDLPQSFNPKSGYIATANHNILPEGYKHQIAFEWAPPYRAQRIKQVLEAKDTLDVKDFQALQQDVVSLPAQALIRVLKTVKLDDKDLEPYVRLLTEWDGNLTRAAKAGPLYALWLRELEHDLFGRYAFKETASLRSLSGLPVLLAALEKPSRDWFGDDPTAKRDLLVKDTLTRAVVRLRRQFPDERDMRWGKVHTVTFRHPLAKVKPEYAEAFNLGPVERPGEANTPNNTRYDESFQQVHGATYRQLFDLADWDRGLATSAPGQSGQPGSPHYADLLPLWAEGQYFPLAYSRAKVEEVTTHRLTLRSPAK